MIEGIDGIIDFLYGSRIVVDQAIRVAGESLVGDMANRIHIDGLDSNGNKIADSYSSKPFWATLDSFVNKSRVPKRLISKSRKSVQLPEGYKSFRAFSGRRTDTVDLRYTGHLQSSYRFIAETDDTYKVGFIGAQESPDGLTAAQKAAYLEGLYKKPIFTPTNEEIDNFFETVAYEWRTRIE